MEQRSQAKRRGDLGQIFLTVHGCVSLETLGGLRSKNTYTGIRSHGTRERRSSMHDWDWDTIDQHSQQRCTWAIHKLRIETHTSINTQGSRNVEAVCTCRCKTDCSRVQIVKMLNLFAHDLKPTQSCNTKKCACSDCATC